MLYNQAEQSFRVIQNHPRLYLKPVKWLICCVLLLSSLPATAQPSGGPYGPVWQKYDLPKVTGRIYYAAPDGQVDETGTTPGKPTTLDAAIENVKTGDAIILRGGIYRTGGLLLNQGITIQPYADEHPVLKGTMIATNWEHPKDGLWKTSWSRLFPSKPAEWWRPRRSTPLYLFNNDMVFVNGRLLQTVGSREDVDENSYFIDYDAGEVYIGTDPANKLVEITAFDSAIIRTTGNCHGKSSDGKGPVIRGITFTQYAFRAFEIEGKDPEGLSDESNHGKDVTGMTLEHCAITYCSRVAGYFRGDNLTIRHCLVSDTSTEGIFILSSSDVLLEKNVIMRNNIEKIEGYFPAAVKIFNQCYRVTCRDNLVLDHPDSNGIWYDVGNVNGVFVNNWIDGTDNGFFFEISKGVICAGNVFVNCPTGIKVLNSCDARIYQNTLVNSRVWFERTARSAVGDHFGWHPSTGPDVEERDGHVFVNNLLAANEQFRRPFLEIRQPSNMYERLKLPQLKQLDYNVYVRMKNQESRPLILWSPVVEGNHSVELQSPEELNKLHSEFSGHSRIFVNYDGPLFKSPELSNYELLKSFPGSEIATELPIEIGSLLGWEKKDGRFPGAFAPCPD
ncbi:MAG: right-handed parallel beta-helix repeat-containing protein [Sedimentisphaerales bacterium]|nr:right-handed parallel beta-helix repeat-containing protein [Sedimentisphaerales bacterium]